MVIVLFFAQIAFFGIAELNYCNAIREATACEGSDAAIEQVMLEHGFDIEAMSMTEPNLLQKSQALVSLIN